MLFALFCLSLLSQSRGLLVGSVFLDLGYERDGCAFHLIDFHDHALSEGILLGNQYGQPWTVISVTRDPGPVPDHIGYRPWEQNVTIRDYDWESRFCNVHLFIRPNWNLLSFYAYVSGMAVRYPKPVFIILVKERTEFIPPLAPDFNLNMYGLQVDTHAHVLNGQMSVNSIYWVHPTDPLYYTHNWQRFNGSMFKDGFYIHENQLRDHGDAIFQIIERTYMDEERRSCPKDEPRARWGPLRERYELLECHPMRRTIQVLLQLINGTTHAQFVISYIPNPKAYSFIYEERGVGAYMSTMSDYVPNTHLIARDSGVVLIYCDYDQQRIRNHYNWLNAFQSLVWVLVIVLTLLATLASSTSICSAGLVLRPCLFNIFRILLGGEGRVETGLHLLILLNGCVLTSYYENHLTSVALAPNPPLVHSTVNELLDTGYKIMLAPEDQEIGFDFIINWFKRNKNDEHLHLSNSSFGFCKSQSECSDNVHPVGTTRILDGSISEPTVENANIKNVGSSCHQVPEPIETSRVEWISFNGYLSGELYQYGHFVMQSGLRECWKQEMLDDLWQRNHKTRREMKITDSYDDNPPTMSILMDFEVMRIFTICGLFHLAAALALLIEIAFFAFYKSHRSGGKRCSIGSRIQVVTTNNPSSTSTCTCTSSAGKVKIRTSRLDVRVENTDVRGENTDVRGENTDVRGENADVYEVEV